MKTLPRIKNIGGFVFELTDDGYYEAKGSTYYDDDHDQVPEPKLQHAALIFEKQLKDEGHDFQIEFGEKGWIELYPVGDE
jgi:hypothetical protein